MTPILRGICLLVFVSLGVSRAQPFLPNEAGTTVNGYQDDFDGTALAPAWLVQGANAYTVNGGVLRVSSASGDPNHLLYAVAGYNNSVQEVLARIRILNFGTADPPRGGISACVDPAASPAGGIDLHFRDETIGRHIEFLDDLRSWGTEYPFAWQNNTWYWLRLRHEPNAASQGGANDVFGKIWLGDGTQAEPAAWQNLYDYIPARSARTGYAGIVAGSAGGTSEFEVDYILIKASGLPSITVAPSSFVQTPVTITNQPQSQTALQCRDATFSVGYSGTPPITFQWYRDNAQIPNAINSSYALSNVQPADNGAVFYVVVSNVASNTPYSVTSSNATLAVSMDTAPPVLLGAANAGLDQVVVTFSEKVTTATANDPSNYSITNGTGAVLPILSATLAANQTNVTLITTGQVEGVAYTLTVNGITDQCTSANTIAPNSQATFMAQAYAPSAIGNPSPPGSAQTVPGGYDVTGGGRDIGGTNDQFQFSYQQRSGDFDLKVRIQSLDLSDAWAEAGLMARESLDPGSRFASVMATPTISGSYFQSRSTVNGQTTLAGSFPVNFPNTWVRLQRVGDQLNGYASLDGQNWKLLGSVTIVLPANLSLGFAVSSHNTNQTTTAAFRDLASASGPPARIVLPAEPLGQSSRRTSLVISEIMYNPLDRPDHINLEFVELFNSLSTPEDISGWRLDGDADFTFPAGTVIPAGGFLVVAAAPEDFEYVTGITGVLGPFSSTNSLPNDHGTIQLRNRTGAVFLEAHYDTETPWPVAADGAGHSLVLARPSYGEGSVEAWAASDTVGGSPGRLDPVTLDPLRNVVINEFLAHTDDPELDFIELYNHSTWPVDISSCFLTDDREINKFTIPEGTVLPPRGFISFNQEELGFSLNADGERIFFRNPDSTRVIDAVRFDAQANSVSMGRSPDGAPSLSRLATKTPGTSNGPSLLSKVVINEIMYHPISGNSDDEFIELHNRSGNATNISGWRIAGGISFTFPANASIPANGYVVVARDASRLISRYPNLNANNTFGNFGGSLANSGERIALAMAVPSISTNNNGLVTNYSHVVINEVTYRDGGRWGQWSDGGGSSLELIDSRSDNRRASNWADSDETSKAPWTIVSVAGVLDNGTSTADQLQALLQGAGECLIDDVEVRTAGGVNLIANSTFETDAAGWTAEGTQQPSGLESGEGYNSARSYHIRATDRGDNQVNRIRTPLTTPQGSGVTNTIRAKVRWLKGHPEMLFRLRGNWLEAPVEMDVPTNLGTPGAPNSRALPNIGPAISDVTHNPPVPAANEAVLVTARVHDPDGVASVQLKYRVDPSATIFSVPMVDDGSGPDAVAGDGLYSATLPGQGVNVLAAFYVEAADQFTPPATSRFPNNAPTRECLVRFGESVPPGSFPSYRIWMTQATFNAWDGRNNLNNTMNDITFVLGNHRVIYNASAVFAGSPYIAPGFSTPTGNRCGYALEFPADDPIFGNTQLQIDWPGGHGNENTAIQEEMAYWIAAQINVPYSHRYFIRLTVNGVTDMQRGGIFEATMQPGGDFLEQWSPGNTDGGFYRIDRAFEFDDAGSTLIAQPEPQLLLYNTPDLVNGGLKKKLEKYRWYFLKRSFDSANDYTNLFVLADSLNAAVPEPYTSKSEGLIDIEQWMSIFCVEHIINNFDSWGHDIGKNMYMFIPEKGRATLYMYDLDWLMLVAAGSYPANSGPLFLSDDPTITRMYNHPPFRRAYFRAVQDAVDYAFVQPKYEAVMDAKYNALVANGITLCDGQALVAPTLVKNWFRDRRAFFVSQLATVASPFTIAGPTNITVTSNLVILSGTAPITVKTIEIDGVARPLTWTSVTNWTLRLPVVGATNDLSIAGYDSRGNLVPGASNRLTVVYDGAPPSETPSVVINEIMYSPSVPNAEYVELFNASTSFAFDMGGWRFNGLDYTFPEGSYLAPRSVMVLARDRTAAYTAYSTNLIIQDFYDGNLQANGETLTLIKPAQATGEVDVVISKVRYEDVLPWSTNANFSGNALQLIDPAQDVSRVGNWTGNPSWVFVTRTGNILNATNLLLWIPTRGNAYVDDISLVGPEGTNVVINGDFESGSALPWIITPIYSSSVVSSDVSHSGKQSLFLNGTANGGGTVGTTVQQYLLGKITPNATYTLSYWCYANTNSVAVSMRTVQGGNLATSGTTVKLAASPGAINTPLAAMPAFPKLWINEVQPENSNIIADNNAQHDPWIELYNVGIDPIALDGLYLSDNYTNLTQWNFPAGSVINPGEFKVVFADGEPGQTTASELHTSFRLSPGAGALALSRLYLGTPQVIDYVNYAGVDAGRSYGSIPDGQPFDRVEFYYATPGAANNSDAAPAFVYINEWMAANTSTLADPADGQYQDWFELFNAGSDAVDLGGYYLSDENRLQFRIPAGYQIPPHGFLLVWADNESSQNNTSRIDLHASFALSRDGETLSLFAPGGALVDSVTFGKQTNDISQGRYLDGTASIHYMTAPTPRAANIVTGSTPPTFNQLHREGDQLTLGWGATAGRTYRVEFTDDLSAGNWQPFGNDILATGTSLSITVTTTSPSQRFFRIILVQ
ncbi:MAG TPA: lamin tail domain-containing protein [Verrucomicrobiae bacterium]|nr:lamin tail domain-containing protein [Verrucomicrobiae bacterium]